MTTANQTALLRRKVEQIYREHDEASARSLREFLDRVVADVVPEQKRFGLVEEGWQRERNQRVIPAAMYIAGMNPTYDSHLFFWEGYHKGCDKSGTIARIADWMLGYSKRPLRGFVAAKDADQARVVYDAMQKTADLNKSWLGKRLSFQRNRVVSEKTGSRLEVLTSDAGGVAGITPDFIICDELSQWSDYLFWDGLFGGAMKRSGIDPVTKKPKGHCLVYVITNAGFTGTWQYELREDARKDNILWSFYENPPDTILPSWLSPQVIASVRRGMTEWEAKRLLDNRWIDPSMTGERFFSPDDVDGCVGVPSSPPVGAMVYLSIDYGEKKDRTALSVVWADDAGIVHVPEVTVYAGSPDKPVLLRDVEHWVDLQIGRYPNVTLVFDSHQTLALIQRYESEGRKVKRFEYRSGKNNQLMADNLRTLMKDRRIRYSLFTGLVGGSTLVDEFKQVIAKEKVYGYRIDHRNNSHDDRVVSVGMAALVAVQEGVPQIAVQKDDVERLVKPPISLPTNRFDTGAARRRQLFGMG